ncbi:MAG TPA: AMP-binding protein [Sedimentibacter sp.]|jgi:long-chain acyl-CoA synthetase|nr:AMP-binding protein [Sedimentibacter sp.]HOW22381.1 AMP-binding protein [Sedimentibacter sp.]HRC80418.1 AMP-binding protein [Sedimentibacter sp.]
MLRKEEDHISDLRQLLEKNTDKYKEKTAFWMKNKNQEYTAITYNQLYTDLCGLVTSLKNLGMKDKRIAIIGKNSYEWVVSYLAALYTGDVPVLLDSEFCLTELKYFLNITEISCVFFSNELEDVFLQIENDGVTGLETLISMDKEKSEEKVLSLKELIEEGKKEESMGE